LVTSVIGTKVEEKFQMWIEESLLIGTFTRKHQTLQTKQNYAISQGWAEGQDKDVSRTTSKVVSGLFGASTLDIKM
jgi:hypothetical protein